MTNEALQLHHTGQYAQAANERERRATVQSVPSEFATHAHWLHRLCEVRWPIFASVKGQRHFLFVHIFSGRWREGDFHACIAKWATQHNILATILPIDTANSVTMGNLQMRSASCAELLICYKQALVSATLAGTPCEALSKSRHQQGAEIFPEDLSIAVFHDHSAPGSDCWGLRASLGVNWHSFTQTVRSSFKARFSLRIKC